MRTWSICFFSFIILSCWAGCTGTTPTQEARPLPSNPSNYTESKIETLERQLERVNAEIAKKNYKLKQLEENRESKAIEKMELRDRIKSLDEQRHYILRELRYLKKMESQE